MFEERDDLIICEPGSYIAAHSMMVGTTENVEEDDDTIDCISLIFIDTRDKTHPVLLHPKGELLEYLISDNFRELVQKLKQKLVDREAW